MLDDDCDPIGRFKRDTLQTSKGYNLATYAWYPDCDPSSVRGCVFLFHSLRSHARFEYLDPNDDYERVVYEGSIPARLNELGLVVFAHDHPGHGLTTGQRAYWDNMDDLRDAAIEYCEAALADNWFRLAEKPRFVMGMSMGGTVAIQIAKARPDLFNGHILLSPAVCKPDTAVDSFVHPFSFLRPVLNVVMPQLKVLQVPLNPDPAVRKAVEKDELVIREPISIRVMSEFMRVYDDFEANAASIKFSSVLVVVGSKDPIVSAAGIAHFMERVQAPDKRLRVLEHLGHEVIREDGCDVAREEVFQWILNSL